MINEQEIIKKLETLIKLIGKFAFGKEEVKNIVIYKKGSKAKTYIESYNSCDGSHSVAELSKIAGVKPQTISPILQQWEDKGIVYKAENGRYKKLFSI